jgi:hypothetical protein
MEIAWISINATLNAQHSTLNTQRSTFNTQRSTLNIQRSTFKFNSGCLPIGVHLILICGENELHFFVFIREIRG